MRFVAIIVLWLAGAAALGAEPRARDL